MWRFLIRLLKGGSRFVTKRVVRRFKTIRHPIKSVKRIGNRILRPERTFARRIQKYKKIGSKVKRILSPKTRALMRVENKMRIVENLVYSENELLGMKTSVEKMMNESTQTYVQNPKLLKTLKKGEIETLEKAIDKELEGLGINSAEDISRVINDEQFREDIVKTNSYRDFMENWKNGFFAYNPEDLGMSEDEREAIWEEIEASKSYGWFSENKIN